MSRNFNGYISSSYVYVYKYQTIFVWICGVVHIDSLSLVLYSNAWPILICKPCYLLEWKETFDFCLCEMMLVLFFFFLLYNFSINFYILFIKKCFFSISPRFSVITSLIQRLLSTRTKPGYVSPVIALFFIELALNSRKQLLVTLSL